MRLFGSAARGEDHPDSDVDVPIDFEPGSPLFDVLHLTAELERLLGRDVDVVSTGGLKPRNQHILDEAIDLEGSTSEIASASRTSIDAASELAAAGSHRWPKGLAITN